MLEQQQGAQHMLSPSTPAHSSPQGQPKALIPPGF